MAAPGMHRGTGGSGPTMSSHGCCHGCQVSPQEKCYGAVAQPPAVPTLRPSSVCFAPSMPHPTSPLHLEEETNELNEGTEQELTEKQRTEQSVCEAATKPCRSSPALLQLCTPVVHPGSPHLSSDHWVPSGPFTPCRPPGHIASLAEHSCMHAIPKATCS